MKPSVLILAAGMGSRYGSLKQVESFGPEGQTLIDYTLSDARLAGIERAVFVIRRDFADTFERAVLDKWRGKMELATAFQDLNDLPAGRKAPEGRTKPWGTAHAVLAAKKELPGPFVMVNADDFYGPEAFRVLSAFFGEYGGDTCAMAGYRLDQTLSPHGGVTRAICTVNSDGFLSGMTEWKGLCASARGGVESGAALFRGNEPVSMNCFGFQGSFMEQLEARFEAFLLQNGSSIAGECLIPEVVGSLVSEGKLSCKVLEGAGHWFGVTFPEDKERVKAELARLHAAGLVMSH